MYEDSELGITGIPELGIAGIPELGIIIKFQTYNLTGVLHFHRFFSQMVSEKKSSGHSDRVLVANFGADLFVIVV